MNPLLQKTQAAIEAKINPPQLKPVVDKLVAAGTHVMYAPTTRDMLVRQMQGPGDDFEKIGAGVAKLMGLLSTQAKGTIPPQAMIPAAIILMCEAMDFLAQAGRIQVTPDTLAKAMQETASALLQLLGVSPQKLQSMVNQSKAGGAAPGAVPGAATPAPTGIIGSAIGGA